MDALLGNDPSSAEKLTEQANMILTSAYQKSSQVRGNSAAITNSAKQEVGVVTDKKVGSLSSSLYESFGKTNAPEGFKEQNKKKRQRKK